MHMSQVSTRSVSQGDQSRENPSRREVLKLSDLDTHTLSDLSGMFGLWKETDHCDKDDR